MEEDIALRLTAEDAMEWHYRGEGAGNIVLYHLNSNPLLIGKVLRLKKVSSNSNHLKKRLHVRGKPVLSKQEQILWADWPSVAIATSIEILVQTYAQNVIRPLLGHELVDPGVIVSVSSEFLENLASRVENARPSWRAEVSQIDPCSHHALLMSDHSVFWSSKEPGNKAPPSISVEIKPKCGFLPDSDLIAAKNIIKKKVSRFAMHQTLKHSNGQIKKISQYSPLELFSGNLERISQAVNDLFENPQNNLRVFIEGKIIDNIEFPNSQPMNEALMDCFPSCETLEDAIKVLKSLVSQSLYENDVLKNLLAAQKLDKYDIEGVMCAYWKAFPEDNVSNGNTVDDKKILDEKVIKATNGFPDDVWNGMDMADGSGSVDEETMKNRKAFVDNLSLMDCIKIVRDYLIAATTKDCSLMLTFQRSLDMVTMSSDNQQHYKMFHSSLTGECFHLKIRFVDLDLKPLGKMQYYYDLDQQIVRAYLCANPNKAVFHSS